MSEMRTYMNRNVFMELLKLSMASNMEIDENEKIY